MAENEGGDSRFLSGFLLGFLAGVLICLGIGGSFLFVTVRRQVADERLMRQQAVEAEARARRAVDAMGEKAREAEKADAMAEKIREAEKKARADKDKEGK